MREISGSIKDYFDWDLHGKMWSEMDEEFPSDTPEGQVLKYLNTFILHLVFIECYTMLLYLVLKYIISYILI